jgi:2-polyprenyl-6-methoxyphenol hydroxylase-like FAD-dependent oxidoreductase
LLCVAGSSEYERVVRQHNGLKPKTAIVGAGVFGITTALEIVNHGHMVTLFERQKQIPAHSDERVLVSTTTYAS